MKISENNDAIMRTQSLVLYGNTKFTDEQILYFVKKHKGSLKWAARELCCEIKTIRERLIRLGLYPGPKSPERDAMVAIKAPGTKGKGRTSELVREGLDKTGGNLTKTASYVGISVSNVQRHAYKDKPKAKRFIEELQLRGVIITATSNKIKWSAPKGIMTAKVKRKMLEYKWCIISIINGYSKPGCIKKKVGKNGITGPKARAMVKRCGGNKNEVARRLKV
jgi:hypothetical protein